MEKLKLPPINSEQKRIMLEYVQKFPHIARQKFSQEFTFKKAQMHWEELTEMLNSVPGGSKKTWMQWRKTWTDLKKNTKHKASGMKKYSQATGGGPAIPKEKDFTDIEKGILEIIGNVMQEGHEAVTETPVEFEFCASNEFFGSNTEVELNHAEIKTSTPQGIHLDPSSSTSRITSKHQLETSKNQSHSVENDHSYTLNAPSGIGRQRLRSTQRLETSQKLTTEMVKSMEYKNGITEDYYKKKCDYFQHMQEYHQKKIDLLQNTNEIAKEMLTELKAIKTILMENQLF